MDSPDDAVRVRFFVEIVVKRAKGVPHGVRVRSVGRKLAVAVHSESLEPFCGKKSFEGIGSG